MSTLLLDSKLSLLSEPQDDKMKIMDLIGENEKLENELFDSYDIIDELEFEMEQVSNKYLLLTTQQ